MLGAPVPASARRSRRAVAAAPSTTLPAWPLGLLLVGFPLWWVLGLATFAVMIVGAIMAMLLIQVRPVVLPAGFTLWLLFLAFVFCSSLEIDSGSRLVGYGVRVLAYLGATAVFVYVVNAPEHLPPERVLAMLVFFLAVVVVGGYLGMFFPHGSITTVVEHLLPKRIDQNSYVQSLVHPAFAEIQQPYGSPVAFNRPSAPFPYTNSWGVNTALLVPLAAASFCRARTQGGRVGIVVLLAAGLPPALATLNRGMFLAIGVTLVYVAVRLAVRGRLAGLISVIGFGLVGALVAVLTGAYGRLNARLQYSQSTDDRQLIYREAWQGALHSPLFGNGTPKPSQTLAYSVGTQGQLWNLMFSYGFPALVLFIAFFVYCAVVSARARTVSDLWVHSVPLLVLFTIVFYGYDGPQLAIGMVGSALAVRTARQADTVARR